MCCAQDVRARSEAEEFVIKAVWIPRTDTGALGFIPDLCWRTAECLVAIEALALAGVGVVGVFLCVAVVRLDATATLTWRVLLIHTYTEKAWGARVRDRPPRPHNHQETFLKAFRLCIRTMPVPTYFNLTYGYPYPSTPVEFWIAHDRDWEGDEIRFWSINVTRHFTTDTFISEFNKFFSPFTYRYVEKLLNGRGKPSHNWIKLADASLIGHEPEIMYRHMLTSSRWSTNPSNVNWSLAEPTSYLAFMTCIKSPERKARCLKHIFHCSITSFPLITSISSPNI